MNRRRTGISLAALALTLAAAPALAQEAPPPSPAPVPAPGDPPAEQPPVDGTPAPPRAFTPADFARFAPRNALDMLRNIPGFAIREQVQERGFGEATGNVLLNGQRLSGKSEDIQTRLGRIPAQTVIRIEIVDGAALQIPGLSGQVANVVVRAGGGSGQFAWRPEFRARFTDPVLTRLETSVSGRGGAVEYTLGLENQAGHGGAGGETIITTAEGDLIERRDDVSTAEFNQPRVSAQLAIDGPGSSVGNVNASYRRLQRDLAEDGLRTGSGRVDRMRSVRIDEDGYSYEVGGDLEFALGGGRLKLIALDRFSHSTPDTIVITRFADGAQATGDRFARQGDSGERIGRVELRWTGGGADWQLSAEAAFNSLDNVSSLFRLNPAGEFDEIPLPGGSASVTEDRYQMMATYGRELSPALRFQLAVGGEYSQLAQVGGGGIVRTFGRPKGQLSVAWKPDPRTDINLRLQRRVGQLNFFDFLASVNVADERQNAGNPNLVPPQVWEAEVELVRNLGAYGNATLRLYGHAIDDIVDTIPIGATGESPGNIDRATRFGAELRSTINFDPLGWRGAKIDLRGLIQESRLEDPLTGETRPISNADLHSLAVNLRHDVPGTDWAWGSGMFYSLHARDYRLTEVGRQWEGPVFMNVYLEHKDVMGLTVRGGIGNVLGADSMWDRTVFVGRRTGPVAFIERRDRTIGPIFSFSVRGSF